MKFSLKLNKLRKSSNSRYVTYTNTSKNHTQAIIYHHQTNFES